MHGTCASKHTVQYRHPHARVITLIRGSSRLCSTLLSRCNNASSSRSRPSARTNNFRCTPFHRFRSHSQAPSVGRLSTKRLHPQLAAVLTGKRQRSVEPPFASTNAPGIVGGGAGSGLVPALSLPPLAQAPCQLPTRTASDFAQAYSQVRMLDHIGTAPHYEPRVSQLYHHLPCLHEIHPLVKKL